MLDVRIEAYVTPLAEQVLDDITPVIAVKSYADEDARITGLIRIYRESTDQLLFTSELATTFLNAGTSTNIAALSAWSPPAPADDDYFILADITAKSLESDATLKAHLGAWHFDIKPGPMGPAPAAHHATHESGGMDELDVTDLDGLLADPQTPLPHHTEHESGGTDEVDHAALINLAAGDPHPQYRPRTQLLYDCDFLAVASSSSANNIDPWLGQSIGSGGLGQNSTGEPNHPGVLAINGSVGGVDRGYVIRTHSSSFLITGGERTDIVLRPRLLAGNTLRFGFHDTTTIADATDGCYIEMAQVGGIDGVIVGKTAAGGARSTTGTNYTLVLDTWYRLRVEVNAEASIVTFTCLNEADAVLWTDTLAANIPTAPGQETASALVSTNSAASAAVLVDVDYILLQVNRALIR